MTTSRAPIAALVLGASLVFLVSSAHATLTKSGAAAVAFTTNATGGMKITGTTNDLTVSDDGTTVKLVVGLGALDTGINLRNSHTKKYLETDRFPTAELSVPRAKLQFGGAGDIPGEMTIHGQKHNVVIHYEAPKRGDSFAVHGTTKLLMTDYGVAVPSYLGVTVKPDVSLDVTFTARDS